MSDAQVMAGTSLTGLAAFRDIARNSVIGHLVLWCLGLADSESQTNEEERRCLSYHAAGKRRLVEIGVWHGVTTRRLRRVMDASGILFAVDPFPPGRLGFSAQRLIALCEVTPEVNGIVRWVRRTGIEAGRTYATHDGRQVDFIFFDGDHSYEGLRDDWDAWTPLVARNGIVAIHDSRSSSRRQINDAGSVIFTREVISRDL